MQLSEKQRHALRRACCSYVGADDRWAALASAGASDAQIIELMNSEMGLGGGSSGPGWVPVYSRGNPPRVWMGDHCFAGAGKPFLVGAELVHQVRLLFGVHQPAAAGQLSLFDQPTP